MKATLEFTLPEESYEFDDAVNGGKWHVVVEDIREELRSQLKYQNHPEALQELLRSLQEKLYQSAQEHGLEL